MLEYKIKYKDEEKHIRLPKASNLAFLKLNIYKHFNVVPNKQLIFGLGDMHDDAVLHCDGQVKKLLVISGQEEVKENVDLIATYLFVNIFDTIPLNLTKLTDLLHSKTRVILLYLSNDGSNEFVDDVICNTNLSGWKECELVIWNISDDTYHNDLQDVLNEVIHNHDDLVRKIVKIDNKSCLFILIPISENPLFSLIENDNLVCCNINLQINFAKNIVENNFKRYDFLEDVTNNYQQYLAVNLGNRDYDCYEANEHNYLKYKIAFAFFGPPEDDKEKTSTFTNFDFNADLKIYNAKQVKFIEEAYEKILKHNNEYSKHTDRVVMHVIYNITEPLQKNKKDDSLNGTYPIFVIRKCKRSTKSCCIYIDHQLRVYISFENYIENVKLPKCVMVLPNNGKYTLVDDLVQLSRYYSPSCGLGSKILEATDMGSSVLGIAGGGLMLLGTVVAVSPVGMAAAVAVSVATGVYGIGRGIHMMMDRSKHDEDMSFMNSEARSAYLNLISGVLSFASAATVRGLMTVASKGAQIPEVFQHLANAISVACVTSSAFAVGFNIYDVLAEYVESGKSPSPFALVQLSTSVLFFAHSVCNFKAASTIINEAQPNSIRRMMNKLFKETTRVSGNAEYARAEVIKTISTANDPRQILGFLSRNNNMFNKMDVRFSVNDGNIQLNGIPIDMNQFNGMSSTQMNAYLSNLPSIPGSASTSVAINERIATYMNYWQTAMNIGIPLIRNAGSVSQIISHLFNIFSNHVQQKLYDIINGIIREIFKTDSNFTKLLNTYDSNEELIVKIVKIVLSYFQNLADYYIVEYEQKKMEASKKSDYNEKDFDRNYFINPINANSAIRFVEKAIMLYQMKQNGLKTIISYIYSFIARLITDKVENVERKKRRSSTYKSKTICKICEGHYYSKS